MTAPVHRNAAGGAQCVVAVPLGTHRRSGIATLDPARA